MADRPLFLFCDANTAVYDTHLLVKQGGLQLVRLLRELRGQIALPAISRTEYLSNFAKVATEQHFLSPALQAWRSTNAAGRKVLKDHLKNLLAQN